MSLVRPFELFYPTKVTHDSYGSGGATNAFGGEVADPSLPADPGYTAQWPWEQSRPAHNKKTLKWLRAIPLVDGNFVWYLYLTEFDVPTVYDPDPEPEV